MAKLFNRAKMTTSTTGSGTVTLGSASVGYQSFADAGVSNGDVVQYVIEEGGNFEIGTGTYSSTGTSLTRSPTESSNSNAAITLGGAATVSITAVADDLNRLQHAGSTKVEPTSTGATVTGNLAVTGTVDGRDVATDGAKLDGIESGATADQTASEILTAIKTVDGSGSGLDADTLDGSHASAFLTGNQTITLSGDASGSGTTSIAVSLAADSVGASEIAANAVGASELNVSGNGTSSQFLRSDGDGTFTWATPTDTNTTYSAGSGLSLSGTTFSHTDTSSQSSVNNSGGTVIQDITLDTYGHVTGLTSYNLDSEFYQEGGTSYNGTYPLLARISARNAYSNTGITFTGSTNTLAVTGNITVGGTVDGRDVASDGTKLDGIESGATADMTASEILTAIKTVDGSGSGLDADTVDGYGTSTGTTANTVAVRQGNGYLFATYFNGSGTFSTSGATSGMARFTGTNGTDTYGRSYTAAAARTLLNVENGATADQTITAGSGLTGGGTGDVTISHADTSSQASVNNSGRTYIQDITLDTYGHITGITSATETVTDTVPSDATITLSAGTNLSGGGAFTTNQNFNETITFNASTNPTLDSATFGSGVVLSESTDRADLLQISSSTSSWGGLQIRNSSNEGRWSFMTDGNVAGIYDDENGDWHIQWSENAGTTMYYNGASKLNIGSTTTTVYQTFNLNNNQLSGVDTVSHHNDTNTYMQFHADDQWRVVVGGSERLEVKNSSPHVLVSGDLNSTSDERLKDNIKPITNALSDVTQLEGVSFDWKDTGTRGHGFIAQQVEPILPDLVNTDEETGMKSVNYIGMIGHLVEAIKEQQEQIDALKKQLNG